MEPSTIRNFAIVAHIDHGKSTLADRLIELTGTVPKEKMREQLLDRMEIEQERGITVKLAPVRLVWRPNQSSALRNQGSTDSRPLFTDREYVLNLIDTPGHVDFSYEVSRTLACIEGVVLLVDASQGIQAQTLANLHLAQKHQLAIIPVVNKIDLPHVDPLQTAQEIVRTLGVREEEILFTSGKTGEGVAELLGAIVERIPPPGVDPDRPFRSLIFDSVFDPYRGVVAFVRVFDGEITAKESIRFLRAGKTDQALEVGYFAPEFRPSGRLSAGEIGYIVTGLKEVAEARVGDTIVREEATSNRQRVEPIPGYAEPQPMVFATLFPTSAEDFPKLREALLKLRLSDASLTFQPEHSPALGAGFRVGCLGLLHLEIVTERLEREYGLSLMVTTPQVDYRGKEGAWEEPWAKVEIVTPTRYLGAVMAVVRERRAAFTDTTYLSEDRVLLVVELPLAEIIVDLYDRIKSASSGYASVHYELLGWRPGDLVRLDILVAGKPVEALRQIVHRSQAAERGRALVERLKTLIPRQWFEVRLQAAVGGRIIAAASIPALRKDVTAKLYGGDITRKRKLLEKQKEGKKKMKRLGSVDIPSDVFWQLLKR